MQQNSNKSKYGRKCLPYCFQTGDGRNDLKYGSSRKIREIWQPYCLSSSWQKAVVDRIGSGVWSWICTAGPADTAICDKFQNVMGPGKLNIGFWTAVPVFRLHRCNYLRGVGHVRHNLRNNKIRRLWILLKKMTSNHYTSYSKVF